MQWSRFVFLSSGQPPVLYQHLKTSSLAYTHQRLSSYDEKACMVQTAKQYFTLRFQVPFEEITSGHESILFSIYPTPLMFAWSVDPVMVVNELETIQVLGKWSSELLMLLEWL